MKKILVTVALGFAMAGGLAACSSGQSAEEEFVSVVRDSLDTPYSDSELVGVGRDACDAVGAGGGGQALQQLALASGMTANDYGFVVGVASTTLCPDQADAFDTIVNG